MRQIFTAKKLEDAKRQAVQAFGVSESQIVFRILEQKKGLMGIGASVTIEAIYEPPVAAVETPAPAAVKRVQDYVAAVYEKLGVTVTTTPKVQENGILLEISSNSRGGTIIGRRGETLDAMQYLSSIIANKGEEDYCRIILDSNGYREKRRQTLEHLAERLAKTVIRNQRATTLEPMNPYERRIIHAKVAEIDGVSSKSVGEDPYRKVVILPLDENGEPIPARRSRGRNNRNDNRNDRKGGYRNHGNGGNRKRNANPHRNREEEIPHKPTNFDDIMSTSFEKDYRKPKPEDDLQVGLYGKIE